MNDAGRYGVLLARIILLVTCSAVLCRDVKENGIYMWNRRHPMTKNKGSELDIDTSLRRFFPREYNSDDRIHDDKEEEYDCDESDLISFNNIMGTKKHRLLKQMTASQSSGTFDGNKDSQYHGTTTIAFRNGDSIILCVDSKASIGNYVGSRTVKKIFPVTDRIVATMAGGAADCSYWINLVSMHSSIMAYKYQCNMRTESYAKTLASVFNNYKGMGLSVGTMIAG